MGSFYSIFQLDSTFGRFLNYMNKKDKCKTSKIRSTRSGARTQPVTSLLCDFIHNWFLAGVSAVVRRANYRFFQSEIAKMLLRTRVP